MAKSGGGAWKGVFWVILIEVVICVIAFLFVKTGNFPMGADAHTGKTEAKLADWAHDSWVNHHAPDMANPVAANDQTLMAGAALYQGNCASCHGGENYTKSPLGRGVYPGAPQFMRFVEFQHAHPQMKMRHGSPAQEQARADHSFYVIKHGIRFTGMPAWEDKMSDNDIWTLVTFMKNMGHLPPNVQQAWGHMPMSPIVIPAAAPTTPSSGSGSAAKSTK